MSRQVPSVGRVVHYFAHATQYFAYGTPNMEFPSTVAQVAFITEVDNPGDPTSPVGLAVFNPNGLFFSQHIPYVGEEIAAAGRWGWPAYVPPVE